MNRSTLPIALALGFAAVAQAQIIHDITPEQIREAIAYGNSAKELSAYKIQYNSVLTLTFVVFGSYTTPFLRVALAANTAKKRYVRFTETDVTPEMTANEIHVLAPSIPLGARVANVETVVVTPINSRDLSQTVQPKRMFEVNAEYKNLFGFTGQGRGMLAVFPLDVWRDGNEVHLVFDQFPGGTDCKVKIRVDKIR